MGMSITQRPIDSGCNFNAVKNPVLYKIRREDLLFTSCDNSAGFMRLRQIGADVTPYFQVGNTVYVKTNSGATNQNALITNSLYSAGENFITTDIAFNLNEAGVVNNLSKRTDWKVYIELFYSSDNTSLTGGVRFSFSPDSSSICLCYIHTILQSFVSASWTLPVAINEVDTNAFKQVYIKYQEYYDGALISSPTSDSGTPVIGVNAAMQVIYMDTLYGYGANLLSYNMNDSGRSWMTRFVVNSVSRRIRMWRGWPFTLSFLWPSGLATLKTIVEEYDAADSFLIGTKTALTSHTNAVNRLNVLQGVTLNDATKKLKVSIYNADSELVQDPGLNTGVGWANAGAGPGVLWTVGGGGASANLSSGAGAMTQTRMFIGTLSSALISKKIQQVTFQAARVSGAGTGFFTFRFYKASAQVGNSTIVNFFVDGGHTVVNLSISPVVIDDTVGFDEVRFEAQFTGDAAAGGQVTVIVFDYSLLTTTQLIEQLSVTVDDPCDQPVMLFWKNSTGGDSFYMFHYSQEQSFSTQNNKKAKRQILFTENIDPVEWEALHELMSTNEVYKNNITELTSTTIKTHSKIGEQVYRVFADGTKVGVIVIPTVNRTLTKERKRRFEVEIEYPETFQ